jgi:hypothetical protein
MLSCQRSRAYRQRYNDDLEAALEEAEFWYELVAPWLMS